MVNVLDIEVRYSEQMHFLHSIANISDGKEAVVLL